MKKFLMRAVLWTALPVSAVVCAQEPKLIVPGQSKTVATTQLPLSLAKLGLLRNDLNAYFAMDAPETGGLTWSRKPMDVAVVGGVRVVDADGRRYMSFAEQGSALQLQPPYSTGSKFTFCAWVLLPAPVEYGILWEGENGQLVALKKNGIVFRNASMDASKPWALVEGELQGWHHIAVTYDGRQTQGFFNGQPLANVAGLPVTNLAFIGNNSLPQNQGIMMANGIDEQFLFSRALKPAEIEAVMKFSQPAGGNQAEPTIKPGTPGTTTPPPVIPGTTPKPRDPNAPNPFGDQ